MANIGETSSMPRSYKSWANAWKTSIKTAFKKGKDYSKGLFHRESTANKEDQLIEHGGIDEFTRWDDGQRRSQSEMKEGYNVQIVQVPYGHEIPFGRLFRKFEMKKVQSMRRATKDLGANAQRQFQRTCFSMLTYGHSATNTYLTGKTGSSVSALGPDGVRLFSTVHPCSPSNSTTWSNALADSKPVGEAGLKAMIDNIHNQLDDKGEPKYMGDGGYIWTVSFEDWPEAKRIVGSDARAGVTDNDMNVYKGGYDGRNIELRWVPYISDTAIGGSTTKHYLVAKSEVEDGPVQMLVSQEFSTDDRTDPATKTAYVGGEFMLSVGFLPARGYCGSLGDDSTYTS